MVLRDMIWSLSYAYQIHLMRQLGPNGVITFGGYRLETAVSISLAPPGQIGLAGRQTTLSTNFEEHEQKSRRLSHPRPRKYVRYSLARGETFSFQLSASRMQLMDN